MISVIIPTRNRLVFLKEAVASVLAQNYPDREIIVVDDASDDGTPDWLGSLDDSHIRFFRLPQHGERSAARNFGMSHARGEFVLFLDDDDRLAPGALGYLAGGVRRCPSAMAVVGNRMYFNAAGLQYAYPHPRRTIVRKIWSDVLCAWVPQVSQCIIQKSVLVEAGGWHPKVSFAEDHELWLRMVRADSLVVVLPEIVAHYRVHPGQTPRVGPRGRNWESRRAVVRRMPRGLRRRAAATLRALRMEQIADGALARRRYGRASSWYAGAIFAAPLLLFSPLISGRLVRGLGKSLVSAVLGATGLSLIRRAKAPFRPRALSGTSQRNLG